MKNGKYIILAALGASLFVVPSPTIAQLVGDGPPLPKLVLVDSLGVDLRTGRRTNTDGKISIGTEQDSVSVSIGASGTSSNIPLWGYFHESIIPLDSTSGLYESMKDFSVDGMSEWMVDWMNYTSDGSSLDWNLTYYIYHRKDGSALHFKRIMGDLSPIISKPIRGYLDKVVLPDGTIFTYNYENAPALGETVPHFSDPDRPVSIKGSNGIEIRLTKPQQGEKHILLVNNAYTFCGNITGSCDNSGISWPTFIQNGYPGYGGSATLNGTDSIVYGNTVRERIVRYQPNGNPVYELSNTLTDPSGKFIKYFRVSGGDSTACVHTSFITKIETSDGAWTYDFRAADSLSCAVGSGSSTAPDGSTMRYGSRSALIDQLGRQTEYRFYQFHSDTRFDDKGIYYIKYPEGDRIIFDYDERQNVVKSTKYPKPGYNLPLIVQQWVYPAQCTPATILFCNKPQSYIDANNNVTSYTYSADHGGILTEVGPAIGGVSPAKKYSYAQKYTWLKNPSGNYAQSVTPIWVKTEERYCQTSALNLNDGSCSAGANDLVVTAYEHQVGSASAPSNLWLKGVAVTANGRTLRTCYDYDALGNRITQTGPRADVANCQ